MTSKEYIDTGILEMYVTGMASESEQAEVEMMATAHPEIRQEINEISDSLENYARANSVTPCPLVKPFLMATIDYTERMKKGEERSFPPELTENSTEKDYAPWLKRPDLDISVADRDDIFAKIIGYTPEQITAIVWLKKETPREIHDTEHERFLIVEGTCDIYVGDKINHLVAGDYFAIPLHEYHSIKVTSSIACKAILQRVAA